VRLILIAYSFGGLVLKSLVVAAHKHENQKSKNAMDEVVQKSCNKSLSNLKGVVFYSVPHVGGIENLSQYFLWQHQQIDFMSKSNITIPSIF